MVGIVAVLGAAMGLAGMTGLTRIPPLERYLEYGWNIFQPNREPEVGDLFVLRHRGLISEKDFYDLMRMQGFDREKTDKLWTASYNLLNADLVVTLYRKGFIDYNKYVTYMNRLGYSKTKADEFEKATRAYPSLSDIVTFAVREVYTPEIRRQYGLDEDLPEEFIKEAAKVGVDEEQAKNFWAAHWALPSLEMGFEMLHRGVITESELMTLMRTQDIMPYWRDKLKQISYTPYTRVDVRRMYQLGILNREQVKRAYLDLGYDEEKAENMTRFTIAYVEPEQRDLSRTMIEKAYIEGEISRELALELLKRLGYDDANAELIIRLKEIDEEEKETKDRIDTIVARFKNGVITQEEAIRELDTLDLKASYRDKIIAQSLRDMDKNQKLPTKADLESWYRLELIDEETYREYMLKLGYRPDDIDFYLKELWLEKLDEEEKKSREENPKLLPRTTLVNLFKQGLIDETRLRKGLIDLRFSDDDIELLVEDAKLKRLEWNAKKVEEARRDAEELAREAQEMVIEKGK